MRTPAKIDATADPTVAYLRSHGIRVPAIALDAMVREAVGRLHRMPYRPYPRPDLTAAEAAVLKAGGFVLEPADLGTKNPLTRTVAELAALLQESLPTSDAAARLGVDPSRIRQRLTSDPPSLYGIRLESGWVVPTFQLEDNKTLPGIGDVVACLDPELHPVTVFRWFHLPNADLVLKRKGEEPQALSPRDWLRLGLPIDTVAELAGHL